MLKRNVLVVLCLSILFCGACASQAPYERGYDVIGYTIIGGKPSAMTEELTLDCEVMQYNLIRTSPQGEQLDTETGKIGVEVCKKVWQLANNLCVDETSSEANIMDGASYKLQCFSKGKPRKIVTTHNWSGSLRNAPDFWRSFHQLTRSILKPVDRKLPVYN